MNTLKQHLLPLVTFFITGTTAFLTHGVLPHKIPLVAYRYPGAIVVLYAFFNFVALTDKKRTAQLETIGLFQPLRDGAFLVCTHAHLIEQGQLLGWVSLSASMPLGSLSWAVLLTGIYAHYFSQGILGKWVDLMAFNRLPQTRHRFCTGLFLSGVLGIIGTFVAFMPLAWLLIPLAITGFVSWRQSRGLQ